MSGLARCCATRRLPRFSRHPLWRATSPSTSRASPVSPRQQSSRLTCWTSTPRRPAAEIDGQPELRICNTPPGRPAHQRELWSRTETFRPIIEQIMSGYFGDRGGVAPPDTTVVSWVPFFHDMGLISGNRRADSGRTPRCAHQPSVVPAAASAVDAVAGKQRSARFPAAPNIAFELAAAKTSDDDLAGLDLGDVGTIISGAERVQPATLRRFAERFARFNFHPKALRPSYGLAEATVYVATRESGQPPAIVVFRIRGTDRRPRETVRKRRRYAAGQLRCAAVAAGAHRRSRDAH